MKNLSPIIRRNVSLAVCFGVLAGGIITGAAQSDVPGTLNAQSEQQIHFTPGVRDVLKMIDAKVDASIVIAYIKNSPAAYNPTASEIIALKQRGVPDEIITSLLQRGAEVRTQMAQAAFQANAPLTPPAGPAPYGNGYGAAAPDDSYPSYADYGYGYPSYASYPYYGYPYNYWYNSWYPWFYSPFYSGYYGHHFHGYYGHGGFDHFGGHSFAHGSHGSVGFGNHGGAWAPARGGVHGFATRSFSGVRTAGLGFSGRSASFSGRSAGFSGGHMGGFSGGHGGFGGGGGGHGGGHR
jgi:hypothetical protein